MTAVTHGGRRPSVTILDGLVEVNVRDLLLDPATEARLTARDATLARWMARHGQLAPITIVQHEHAFRVVDGRRRVRAARSLGWVRMRALLRSWAEDEALVQWLHAAWSHEPLTALDEAHACARLAAGGPDFQPYQEIEIAEALGQSRHWVRDRLRLLQLPTADQTAVALGHVSLRAAVRGRRHAVPTLRLQSPSATPAGATPGR